MAANIPETATQWMPLEDGLAPRVSHRSRLRSLAAVSLVLMGLFGLASIVLFLPNSQLSDPDALMIIDHTPLPKDTKKVMEHVTAPLQIMQATSIHAFNELLKSTILTDAKTLYDAIPLNHLEVLFQDFLGKLGSVVPNVSSAMDTPRHRYSSHHEYLYRFDNFKKNILMIMRQNAEEYAHSADIRRARFGITVHADWTEEEFQTTRFNLKATDLSQVQALIRKSAAKKPLSGVQNFSVKPMDLAETCKLTTGGTCRILGCSASRGAVCFEGSCVCSNGACALGGKCVRPGNCRVATGGSCWMMGCSSWRNAQCVKGSCVCPPGQCAVEGKCVHASPDSSSTSSIQCSKHFSGPVRNQGSCGDCWAFSTAQQLRYMVYNKYKKDPGYMSVQYLVDCMPDVAQVTCREGVKGCCGGLPLRADEWLRQSGGLPTQQAYGPLKSDKHPSTAYTCKSSAQKKVLPRGPVERYATETDIANALCKKGPVSVAIAANTNLMHYIGGIMNVNQCPAAQINHAVLYTGVDSSFDNGSPVHIILNSWGSNWGVPTSRPYEHTSGASNGHVLFKFGENTCNMEGLASSPEDVEFL